MVALVHGSFEQVGSQNTGVHNLSEALELHSNLSIDRLRDNLEVLSSFVGCFSLLWMYIESFP